jgi:glucose/arabinose dehydrogenase
VGNIFLVDYKKIADIWGENMLSNLVTKKHGKALGKMFLLYLFLLMAFPAQAHAPADVSLNYDSASQILNATITHTVTDPASHYVKRVDVTKNDIALFREDYASQPKSSKFTYSFKVNATSGDELMARATCSIAGSTVGNLKVLKDTKLEVQSASSLPLNMITLPQGFSIEVFAQNLSYPRSMTISPDGTIFVGTRLPFEQIDSGNLTPVYAIKDVNGNSLTDEKEIKIVDLLKNPNGIAFHEGSLFVAEIDRILRYDEIENKLNSPPEPKIVSTLPYYILHGWRYIAFGPDGKLYVAMGANCNVCTPEDELNATIMRMNPDGTEKEVFARGVRNSVGMDWDPRTNELWFTDNGRDLLGNDVPSDELNHASVANLDFGFPSCHSGSIPDPELGSNQTYQCFEKVPPAWALGPHVAPLGMRFYMGKMFPPDYQNRIFIAEHGSWNRDTPIGYRIVTIKVENNTAVDHEIFAQGWLQGGKAWGRPVDVQPLPDGSLLVSDDLSGIIYRITYSTA